MADTSDIFIAAGALGAAYWFTKRHDRDLDENRWLTLEATANARQVAGLRLAQEQSARAHAASEVRDMEARLAELAHRSPPASTAPNPPSTPRPSPPMVAVRPAPTQPITRAFDPLFAAYGPTLPTSYLRALAAHESDLRPDTARGDVVGLFSVAPMMVQDYNERHGAHFSMGDMANAIANVQVAADFIRSRIIAGFTKNHPDIPNLREDWTNPRFVELVTFGWLCARAHNQPYAKYGVM